MGIEVIIGIVGLVITAIIGAWQIHLARQQNKSMRQPNTVIPQASSPSRLSASSSSSNQPNRQLSKLQKSSLVFVSGNRNKLEEFCNLLNIPNLVFSQIHVPDFSDVVLESLVRHKIEYAKKILPPGTPFFVEQTALAIDGWNGLPGGLTKQFIETVGSSGICRMMKDFKKNERIARAKSVIGFSYGNLIQLFEGIVIGRIAECPCGELGFGWDNIFIPNGETQTFAQLGQAHKYSISMRIKAAEAFQNYLQEHYQII